MSQRGVAPFVNPLLFQLIKPKANHMHQELLGLDALQIQGAVTLPIQDKLLLGLLWVRVRVRVLVKFTVMATVTVTVTKSVN